MVPGTNLLSNWYMGNVPNPVNPRGGWIQWVGLPMSGKGGPDWDWTTYSWTNGDPQLVVANTSAMCDAIDPDLTVLKGMSGKIIHYVGWADNSTGAFSTVKYYDSDSPQLYGTKRHEIILQALHDPRHEPLWRRTRVRERRLANVYRAMG